MSVAALTHAGGIEVKPTNLDGVAMERASARWSSDWHLLVLVNDDEWGYLARSANWRWTAHWYQSLSGWENQPGYGALVASHAACVEVVGTDMSDRATGHVLADAELGTEIGTYADVLARSAAQDSSHQTGRVPIRRPVR